MALHYNGRGTHGGSPQLSWMSADDDDEGDSGFPSPPAVVTDMATETQTNTAARSPTQVTDSYPYHRSKNHELAPTPSQFVPPWPYNPHRSTMAGEQYWTSTISTSPSVMTSADAAPLTSSAPYDYGDRPFSSGWTSHGIYAVAAIVPIMVLAIMGAVVFFCLRKRRQQRRIMLGQEMKTQRQMTIQPFMAPPPPPPTLPLFGPPSNHSLPMSSLNVPPPVILGPIPSGPNGAYLTGIDTSDRVSVTSNHNQPVDPFADSLAEPPPPYRPRSVAPPSFVSTSRQSSLRASRPPATSQTHLIEPSPSPFDDAQEEEEDDISELSGPTGGPDDDNMSAVSDLSYQNEPIVGRTTV